MNFVEGMEVVYMNMNGLIDFIGQSYVVVRISSPLCPARLLVYRENYKDIEVIGK
jgi:hypothetical protein